MPQVNQFTPRAKPTKVQVTLTLLRVLMQDGAERKTKYDLRTFIEGVPTVKVMSGNPHYAIRVEIDEKHLTALRTAVEGRCTLSFVTELDQLDGAPSG